MKIHPHWSLSPLIAICAGAVAILAFSMEGCDTSPEYYYTCDHPHVGRKDAYGDPDPCCNTTPCCPNPVLEHWATLPDTNDKKIWDPCCLTEGCPPFHPFYPDPGAGSDGGDAGTDGQASACDVQCDGHCLRRVDAPWAGPVLLWTGPAIGEVPGCPKATTRADWTGYADLDIPPMTCPACACDPPSGKCGLPETLTASSDACNTSSGTQSKFGPPAGWDGSCTADNAIQAGAKCNGGPCVKSLTVAPLTLTETGCTPHATEEMSEPASPAWKTTAIMCQPRSCGGEESACIPEAGSSPLGWETCIATSGEGLECPSPYAVKHVFYAHFQDQRTCSECTCAPPAGSQCISTLAVYQDSACKGPAAIPGTLITAQDQPSASTFLPGSPSGARP